MNNQETEHEWWKVPPDEDVMEGAELMELLGEELKALIKENELDAYVYQRMIPHSSSEKERIRNERWLQFHQARVRQLKHVEARIMTRKLPERVEEDYSE